MRVLFMMILMLVMAISGDAMPLQTKNTKKTSPGWLPLWSTNNNIDVPTRFLRDVDEANVGKIESGRSNDQERVGFPSVSQAIDKLAYKALLKMNTEPENIFNKLRFAEANVNLNNNPAFIQWLQYVLKYRAKNDNFGFSNDYLFDILRNAKPEAELVTLFQSLRQVPGMKDLADTMQKYMILSSASSHRLMNDVWLKSRETPKEVFNILGLRNVELENNPLFIQWLRYTQLYRSNTAFSDLQALTFLKEEQTLLGARLGVILQSMKGIPDINHLAQSMQTHLFRIWINDAHIKPQGFGYLLAIPYHDWRYILNLPKFDHKYATLEAYTLQYAADRGGEHALNEVRGLFANNHREAALVAAMKV
ncbi:Secreted RxLR effector peptide protein [Phytophthora palmivora]|uniref:Secreted RxLR effector peptide protein n=1 Tax=Phytophthora palmivora TaxID=4796 RepID=A0A2P4XUH4_9STRA|nr:Secreted RxLR effector peptide protein [Phytophthora palmivora]